MVVKNYKLQLAVADDDNSPAAFISDHHKKGSLVSISSHVIFHLYQMHSNYS